MTRRSYFALSVLFLTAGAISALAAAGDSAADLAISSRSVQDYVALRERPLFAPNRRPASPPPPVAVPDPEPPAPIPLPVAAAAPPGWELVGVVRSTRVVSAMFRSLGESNSFSLRQGESRDGWTLTDVGRFEVSLANGSARTTMRFPVRDGSATTPLPIEQLK